MEAKSNIKDYSVLYRISLLNLVKDPKIKEEMSLKFLIETKLKELDIEIKKDQNNFRKIIISHILRLSLYFINENQFIREDYFYLNDNKIYKAFYELLKNPFTEKK